MSELYMAVTADEYELPIRIADSAKEIAEKMGLRPGTVYSMIHNPKRHTGTRCGYRIVRVEDIPQGAKKVRDGGNRRRTRRQGKCIK